MNKWDVIAFACFVLFLMVSFDIVGGLFPSLEWVKGIKALFFVCGVYFLWRKGNLFRTGT